MHTISRRLMRIALTLTLLLPALAQAQDNAADRSALLKSFAQATKINHPGDDPTTGDGAPNDGFGLDVAISGDTALIGVYGDDTLAGNGAGSAYVFVRVAGAWTRQAKLEAPNAATGDAFGRAVALTGDIAVIGAPYDDTAAGNDAGSVHVFQRSNGQWQWQRQLYASTAKANTGFGFSLDFDGSGVIVGAPFEDSAVIDNIGAAYLFDYAAGGWTAVQRLEAFGTGLTNDFFAHSVAIFGDMAVIGVPFDDTLAGADAGRIYAFVRNAGVWNLFTSFDANDAAAGDYFGTSIALSATTLAIGARWDDIPAGSNAGSVHVFVRAANAYTFQAKITAFDAAAGDYFGSSVALQGDTLLIGAPYANDAASADIGSAYAYVRSVGAWAATHKFVATGGQALDQLGTSVAIDNGSALLGAVSDDVAGIVDVGSAVVFTTAGGGFWSQQTRLQSGGGASGDDFGTAVALAGDVAMVGAPGEDTASGSAAGVVHVFQRVAGNWLLQGTLQANDGFDNARFGSALALSGDSLMVGANGGSGGAYVYTLSGGAWLLQAKLVRADSVAGDNFGLNVAIDGDYAAVAAASDDTAQGQDTGSVTVFVRNAGIWTQQSMLTAPDADEFDHFGASVALSGARALIGAPYDEGNIGAFSGSAYVFRRDAETWSQQAKLTAADAALSDQFGGAVALAGETAVIAASGDDLFGNPDQGSVYVFGFTNNQWSPQSKLFAADGEASDYFGSALAMVGDQIVVGASGDDTAGFTDVGSAYAFARSNQQWHQDSKLVLSDPQSNLGFARSVAVSGATVLLGAPADSGDQTGNSNVGSVYLFGDTVSVVPLVGAHGAISPSGVQNVAVGNGATFTLLPDPGYGIASVSGCPGSLNGNIYTTASLSQDCTLSVSFANTAPSIAPVAAQQIDEDAGTQTLTITVNDAETAVGNLVLSATSSQPSLIPQPVVSAGPQANQRTLTYASAANQNGGPVTLTLMLADGFGQSAMQAFDVDIAARNDAPSFGFTPLPGYAAASSGVRTLLAFASFDAGPDDEDATQGVDDYLVDSLLNDSGVLVPGSVDIANNGTLTFTLTGVGGSAYVNVRVRDNGANGAGDQNTSASKQFAIEVAPSADLQLALDNQRSGVQDGEGVLYTLVVANAGPNTIGGARLKTTHSATLINPMWSCDAVASTAACPSEDAGSGDLQLDLELAANEFLKFNLMADVLGGEGGFIQQTATVEPPAGYVEINAGNNSDNDQDPIVGIGLFSDGFEAGGGAPLTVPAAADALQCCGAYSP